MKLRMDSAIIWIIWPRTLHLCMLHQNLVMTQSVVKNLIEAGGGIGRRDDVGYTPLDWAAYFGHEGLIPMLLPEPMHLTHLFGYSIMEIASVMGHDIFVKTLFFYVAKSDLKYAAGILPKRFKVSIDAQHVLRFEESSEHRNQKQWSAAFIAKAAEGYTLARIALEDQHAKREYLGQHAKREYLGR